MNKNNLFFRVAVIVLGLFAQGWAAESMPAAAFQTPLEETDLDGETYAEWVDGVEKKIEPQDASALIKWVVWTQNTRPGHSGRSFGNSKNPGTRHLRIGFTGSHQVGTLIVGGNVKVSVLKPNAAYPGNLGDDSQWLPAQRIRDGKIITDEFKTNNEFTTWILPPGTRTGALRLTHTAQATDKSFSGWLGGVYVLADRYLNIAPQAQAIVRSTTEQADRIHDESNFLGGWENMPRYGGARAKSIVEDPEWMMLAWPKPTALNGIVLQSPGFNSAELYAYKGPEGSYPRDARDSDWEKLTEITNLKTLYPIPLSINWVDFGKTVTTRALRLRITRPFVEQGEHPHLQGNDCGGKRIWLGEWLALKPLGGDALETVLPPVKKKVPQNLLIPVKFTLSEDGFVTLVIEDKDGKRVRNLVSETPFPKGENIAWWDGTDDLGRDVGAARHGLYSIPAQFVAPGEYSVRGLWRKALHTYYEFGVYNNGNPPWNVMDHTGAWMANHCAPMSALYLPAEKSPTKAPAVFLGAYATEGTDGIIWVDLNGKKMGGLVWIGGLWTAAPYLARDDGPQADPAVQAYVASVGEGENKATLQLRVTGFSHNMSNVQKPSFLHAFAAPPVKAGENVDRGGEIGGLAVRNHMAVCSLTRANRLIFADGKEGKLLGDVPLDSPRGSIFEPNGNLLILSGRQLLRFKNVQGPALPPPQVVVASGLEEPVGITLDAEGKIYISDRGASHQVKVFTAQGKYVRAIGRPGVPRAGAYDPLHMNNPRGMTVDSNQHLWVTEEDSLPKRISQWTLEGKLVKAFYGPPKYGGGGTLDPQDKTRFYYAEEAGTMEFKLNWKKGTFALANILYRPGPGDLKIPKGFGSMPPETVLYRHAKKHFAFKKQPRYFTNCYNSNPTGGSSVAFIFKEANGVIHPVAGMGWAYGWDVLKGDAFKARWPEGVDLKGNPWVNQAFFIWSDANDDGHVQPDEVAFQKAANAGITILPDFSCCVAFYDGKSMKFPPVGFTDAGVPQYDIARGQVLADGVQPGASSGGCQSLVDEDANTVVTLGIGSFSPFSVSGAKNGVAVWSYPSLWPGLHASHESPAPDRPGQLIGTTRLLGGFVKPKGSDAGSVWAMTTSLGSVYLFTSDGLFVGTPFNDCRVNPVIAMPVAKRGMSLDNLSLNGENFWPTMTQTSDGMIYLVNGNDSVIIRLEGLETIRRIPSAPLTVTAGDLQKAQAYLLEVERQRQREEQGGGVLHVTLAPSAPTVDGQLEDWSNGDWVEIDKRGTAAFFDSYSKPYDIRGAVSVAAGKLFAAWKTGMPEILTNSGEMPIAPFKTGGTLELMMAANPEADPKRKEPVAGDMRLTVTRVKGKTLAMLYRPVAPESRTPKVPFSSPWRTIRFDRVDDVSDQVQLADDGKGNYEISIPLDVIGLKPQPGMRIQGDIGILRGNGSVTIARTYWSNKATGIVSDVPSEAELMPAFWGVWEFQAK